MWVDFGGPGYLVWRPAGRSTVWVWTELDTAGPHRAAGVWRGHLPAFQFGGNTNCWCGCCSGLPGPRDSECPACGFERDDDQLFRRDHRGGYLMSKHLIDGGALWSRRGRALVPEAPHRRRLLLATKFCLTRRQDRSGRERGGLSFWTGPALHREAGRPPLSPDRVVSPTGRMKPSTCLIFRWKFPGSSSVSQIAL